jgi:hypothetical protein
MALELTYPHIIKHPDAPARLERHPRTRVAMIVADYLYRGWSGEEIARHYRYLSMADIHAALTYYFDHRDEIEGELLAEDREAQAWRQAHPAAPLLLRLKAQARH